MSIVTQINTFLRAEEFIKDWKGKKILDYGGNIGSLMTNSKGIIQPEHYTCIDISLEAINHGEKIYPNATWIHYDRYNPAFNKESNACMNFDHNQKYDIIFSHSVFTHTSIEEWIYMYEKLKKNLNPDGVMCHTYIDFEWNTKMIDKLYQRRVRQYGKTCYIQDFFDYCYFIDNNIFTQDFPTEDRQHILTYYKREYLEKTFPDCRFERGIHQSAMMYSKCI